MVVADSVGMMRSVDKLSHGAGMDTPLPPPRRWRTMVAVVAAGAGIALAGLALWQLQPRGLQVPLAKVRFATVEQGLFRDELALRAMAAPLQTVMLDAVDSGRVEEVLVRDGDSVQQGAVLFRLSNPQRHLELLARESEHAQQISNLTNLRVAAEASRTQRQRRVSDQAFAVMQAEKQHQRNLALSEKGFLSAAALEESADRLAQQRKLLLAETDSNATESAIQQDALRQMEQAIARLDAGLRVVGATIDGLTVRAPANGRLTDFHLQVGETVRPDQHLGRIDDLARFKLSAQVDEYYLARVAVGLHGSASIGGAAWPVTVSGVYPQIKDGHFTLELMFDGPQAPTLRPGQSSEISLALGGARKALLLPFDAWLGDGGGQWAYVLERDGTLARRRAIRTGRRSQNQVELLSGLAAGERVLVSPTAAYGVSPLLQFTQ